MNNEKDHRLFLICQNIAIEILAKERLRSFHQAETIYEEIFKSKIRDEAKMLMKLVLEEIKSHNTVVETQITKVRNMRYDPKSWHKSTFFKSVNIAETHRILNTLPDEVTAYIEKKRNEWHMTDNQSDNELDSIYHNAQREIYKIHGLTYWK
jgi:hypothetical protein